MFDELSWFDKAIREVEAEMTRKIVEAYGIPGLEVSYEPIDRPTVVVSTTIVESTAIVLPLDEERTALVLYDRS